MKLRNIILACAVVLALVFVRAEKADAGGYVSISPYGVHINVGHGYYRNPYYYRPTYYQPYYGYQSYYYRPYRRHYYGSSYYPSYGHYYHKPRYYRTGYRHW